MPDSIQPSAIVAVTAALMAVIEATEILMIRSAQVIGTDAVREVAERTLEARRLLVWETEE